MIKIQIMKNKIKKKINLNYMYFIFLFFFLIKLNNLIFIYNIQLDLDVFFRVLRDNFFDYIIFSHTQPILIYIFHKIIAEFSNIMPMHYKYFYFIFNSMISLFFINFIVKIYKQNLYSNNFLIFIIILLIFAMSPYDVWRLNHHDHFNFALILLNTNLLYNRIILNHSNEKFIYLSLFLLTNSYSLGLVITIVTLFFLAILKFKKKQKFFLKYLFIFLICIAPFLKNLFLHDTFSSSTMLGANLLQRTAHAIGSEKLKILINEEKNLPIWWKACFNDIYKSKSSKNNNDSFQSSLAHGNCFKKNYNDKFSDFETFLKKIDKIQDNKNAIRELNKDIFNLKEKNWIYETEYYESSPNIARLYQSFGSEIFFSALLKYPNEMLLGKVGKKGIFLTVPLTLSNITLFPDYYEKEFLNWNVFSKICHNILKIIFFILILITPYIFYKSVKNYKNFFMLLDKQAYFYTYCLICITSLTLLTSTVTCCENPRIASLYLPFTVFIVLYNFMYLKKNKNK